jgi:hypothetical protein
MHEEEKKCPCCGIDRPIADFYKKHHCYKCIYIEKLQNTPKYRHCKMCKKIIPSCRMKFCSQECQKEFNEDENRRLWWRNIAIESGIIPLLWMKPQ